MLFRALFMLNNFRKLLRQAVRNATARYPPTHINNVIICSLSICTNSSPIYRYFIAISLALPAPSSRKHRWSKCFFLPQRRILNSHIYIHVRRGSASFFEASKQKNTVSNEDRRFVLVVQWLLECFAWKYSDALKIYPRILKREINLLNIGSAFVSWMFNWVFFALCQCCLLSRVNFACCDT